MSKAHNRNPSFEPERSDLSVALIQNDIKAAARGDTDDSKRSSIFWSVCSFILITELCERLAYYGLTGENGKQLLSCVCVQLM
jgi:hypothetical protein